MKKYEKDMKKDGKRGPVPDHLRIDDFSWENAVKKALTKKRPEKGWPKEEKKKK